MTAQSYLLNHSVAVAGYVSGLTPMSRLGSLRGLIIIPLSMMTSQILLWLNNNQRQRKSLLKALTYIATKPPPNL